MGTLKDADWHDRRQRYLENRSDPYERRCDACGEIIKGDFFYYINGEKICRECFKEDIENFIIDHQWDMYRYDEV